MDGVALQLHAGETLASPTAVLRVQEQVFDLLARNLPVCVLVAGLQGELPPEVLFVRACKLLQRALLDAGCCSETIAIATAAGELAPKFASMVRAAVLGRGSVYLLLNRRLSRPAVDARRRGQQERFWLQCWNLRDNEYLRTAFAPCITSPCPLFAAEAAAGILPSRGLQVPPGTAWAIAEVNLADSAGPHGDLSELALRERLRRCVDYGDRLHDEGEWPTAAMRQDSWSNRRLAICVSGIGDLVQRRRADPQSLATLHDIAAVLKTVRETLDEHSRALAASKRHAPGLDLAADGVGNNGIAGSPAWRHRWQQALQFTATRHRNLLSISPWAVFPAGQPAAFRYADLLPVLACADSCSFRGRPRLRHWNVNEFKYFHQRTWAILEQKDAQQMIAEQV
jgi:hypothetical protein